jgi:hypothetical protein
MKLIVMVDCTEFTPLGAIDAINRDEDIMTEVWKGIQKQLEEKGYKIITLSVEEYKEK